MKNMSKKETSTSLIRRLTFWDYVLVGTFLCFAYSILGDLIKIHYLKKEGMCTKAVLKYESRSFSYNRNLAHIVYVFKYNGKSYEGDSYEDDKSTIGDTICVVYLEAFPDFNRPFLYLDHPETNCNCR